MKIVVSVNELSAETQVVIDNMRRSKAPVMIGDAAQPQAVLISYEEYQRLQSAAQAPAPAPASRPPESIVPDETQPISSLMPAAPQPAASAEVVPAAEQSEVAKRAASTVQADRAAMPEPKVVSQRPTAMQADPTLAAKAAPAPPPQRAARLTKPMPKGLPRPPRPLATPRPQGQGQSIINVLLANWQTVALVAGVVVLGLVGFALIVNAFGG